MAQDKGIKKWPKSMLNKKSKNKKECNKLLLLLNPKIFLHRSKATETTKSNPEKRIGHRRHDFNSSYYLQDRLRSGQMPEEPSSFYYLRPGWSELLMSLNENPRCEIAFYCSMKQKNLIAILKYCEKHLGKKFVKDIFGVFGRSYNKRAPTAEKYWERKRDLNMIFDEKKVEDAGFTEKNTIMIEADAFKMVDWPDNFIEVPKYGRDEVLTEKNEEVLKKILDYLQEIVFPQVEQGASVKEIKEKNPFRIAR